MSWLRKALAHLALARSDAALIKASGGAPREVRGLTLDPRFQFMENEARKRAVDLSEATPQERRAVTAKLSEMFGGGRASQVRIQQIYVTGRSHSVPGRLYLPQVRNNSAAMLVYYHFGGGVVGSVENCDRFCSFVAKYGGAPVLSVEYRLAPEHRFPAGLEDATSAYAWALENAARFGARAGRAAVGGDSIGGSFAAVIAQEAKRAGRVAPVLQLLIYPWIDLVSDTASMHDFSDAFPLTSDLAEFFLRHYLPENVDPSDPRLSPGRVADLKGLAPALVYTAGFDMLLDQGEAYADRLAESGVKVKRACFENLPHGFIAMSTIAPAADAALKRIAMETAAALMGKWET